jgi:uncharacterized membrane protein YciS (DUF1049 family)
MRLISIILSVLLVVIGIAFTLLNSTSVEVNYFIDKISLPLPVLLLIALGAGILLSMIFMGIGLVKLKAQNTWLESKLKRTQEQHPQNQL